MKPEKLWKTTIVIYTNYDPKDLEITDLAEEARDGCAFCSKQETTEVPFDEAEVGEFFDNPYDDDED